MKRILIAPACFKGSLHAWEAADYIRQFLAERLPTPSPVLLDVCPIADGGDDTLRILRDNDPRLERHTQAVMGPLPGMTVEAEFLLHPEKRFAVVEAAQAHGLKHLPLERRNPLAATSYGVGELINAVLIHCQRQKLTLESLIVTVGGSASTDGGAGALQALGLQCLDASGKPMPSPLGGRDLTQLGAIERLPDWPHAGSLKIATDVINPLLGPTGAAAVFAPQKGASPEQCELLEVGLARFSQLLSLLCGVDHSDLPGAGAAGGLAYGLRHLPRSGLISGTQWIADCLSLEARITAADLIITGEGCLDETSFNGKATGHVLVWAGAKPVFALCGQVQPSLHLPENIVLSALADYAVNVQAAFDNPRTALHKCLETLWPQIKSRLSLGES